MVEYDFIAIGDTVTDAFIHLNDKSAHLDIDRDVRELCMRFGAKVPYDEVYVISGVGNSANAANAAARLGLRAALVTNIGDDDYGKDTLAVFKSENVATDFITAHAGKKTNYHYVLWYEDDRTILIKHEEYEYRLPDIGSPKWIYLSSLGKNSLPFHEEFIKYLAAHPGVKLAFQPGTYQMRFGKDALKEIYRRADIFFVNKDEAKQILGTEEDDGRELLKKLRALGPKIVVITDGPLGALAFDGTAMWFMPAYPDPKPPLQRTGAGDAFSSTVTAALCMGMNFEEALRWGPVNSMSVVQKVGARAGLLKRQEIETYLKNAPANYKPRALGETSLSVTLGEILNRATKEQWATGHFNVSESDQVRAVCEAAKAMNAPAIFGTSESEAKHLGMLEAVALRDAMRKELGIPIFLNADHHKSVEAAKAAIDAGYDSVHIDLSAKSLEENIRGAKEVVDYARAKNPAISVEGEVGYIVTEESKVYNKKIEVPLESFTKPEEAKEFVEKTGVNRLAIAVGNIHGISLDEPALDIERIKTIRAMVPDSIALVLHAGSGIPNEQIKAAIEAGIANIHINTDIRLAYTKALRDALAEHPEESTPYKFDSEARAAVKKAVQAKLELFGSAYKI